MLDQQALHLLLRLPDSGSIVGECGFTNIVRGPFQACHLGFSPCRAFQGKGFMEEGLCCAIGFEQEGRARAYLHIDGQWRDHILSSLINEAYV